MVEEIKHLLETIFLSAAEKGEKKAVLILLENGDLFDVNCTDNDGKNAILVALESRNLDVLEILASDRRIHLGDTLLRAVNVGYTPAVVSICRCLKDRNELPGGLYCKSSNDDFHADMTPVVLAAQHNNVDALKILLEYGARIEDPDFVEFLCEEFTLQHSVGRINVYSAMTGVACLSLTNEDPLKAAFQLSSKMRKLSEREFEFRSRYAEMSQHCENFAADLLDYIRNSSEQNVILTHDPEEWSRDSFCGDFKEPFKVKTAIKYDQKKFVAHPHSQQSLVERWYAGLPGWRRHTSNKAMLLSCILMISFPVISLCYMVAPKQKPGNYLNTPYVRFLCHVMSQLVFLTFLLVHFVNFNETDDDIDEQYSGLNLLPTQWELVILLYIIAMTWKELSCLVNKGFSAFTDNLETKLFDNVTLALYWGWIIFRMVAIWQYAVNMGGGGIVVQDGTNVTYLSANVVQSTSPPQYTLLDTFMKDIVQPYNNSDDMGRIAILNILEKVDYILDDTDQLQEELVSFLELRFNELESKLSPSETSGRKKRSPRVKISRPFSNNEKHGYSNLRVLNTTVGNLPPTHPLLIAEAMLAVAKVFSFLAVVRMTVVHLHVGPMQISFARMGGDILKFTVLFALILVAFSVGFSELYHLYTYELLEDCKNKNIRRCIIPYQNFQTSMLTLFWTLFGMTPLTSVEIDVANHWITEFIGQFLFAFYHLVAIIALLNILIAMMSNTYTRIEEDADIQWKFSRTMLWMSYYEEVSSLSPPFNLLPSWMTLKTFILSRIKGKDARKRRKITRIEKKDNEYKELAKQLVQRLTFDRKGEEDSSSQETLMLQLKEDMSGFKYDIFETLGDMSKTVNSIHNAVDESAPECDTKVGSDLLRSAEAAIIKAKNCMLPIRPDVFTQMKGCGSKEIDFADDDDDDDVDDDENDDDSNEMEHQV